MQLSSPIFVRLAQYKVKVNAGISRDPIEFAKLLVNSFQVVCSHLSIEYTNMTKLSTTNENDFCKR